MNTWKKLGLCASGKFDPDWWFDGYNDVNTARIVDDICRSCPVRLQCLEEGLENKDYGCWGGVFLDNGKPDKGKNAHKSEKWKKELRNL